MSKEVNEGKPVNIYGEHSGSTTEVQLTGFRVDRETKNYYVIPNGWKLKIYELEVDAEGETRVMLKLGTTDTYAKAVTVKRYKLASAGKLHISYKMPWIIEAHAGDLYLFISLIQAVAKAMSVQFHGEIEELT